MIEERFEAFEKRNRQRMKFREQRGSLAESMETLVELDGADGLIAHLLKVHGPFLGTVKVKPYGFDHRIGWNTHIVTVDDLGVVGFTDGSV